MWSQWIWSESIKLLKIKTGLLYSYLILKQVCFLDFFILVLHPSKFTILIDNLRKWKIIIMLSTLDNNLEVPRCLSSRDIIIIISATIIIISTTIISPPPASSSPPPSSTWQSAVDRGPFHGYLSPRADQSPGSKKAENLIKMMTTVMSRMMKKMERWTWWLILNDEAPQVTSLKPTVCLWNQF